MTEGYCQKAREDFHFTDACTQRGSISRCLLCIRMRNRFAYGHCRNVNGSLWFDTSADKCDHIDPPLDYADLRYCVARVCDTWTIAQLKSTRLYRIYVLRSQAGNAIYKCDGDNPIDYTCVISGVACSPPKYPATFPPWFKPAGYCP